MTHTIVKQGLLLLALAVGCAAQAQKKPVFELSTLDKLKATASSHFDAGLPDQNFGKWFKRLVYPAAPDYQETPCDSASSGAQAAAKPQCYVVTAPVGMQKVTLRFAFDAAHNDFKYVDGMLEPSDPRNKRMTKKLQKLSDLPGMVHPQGQ
jgi:hypothetical protein